MAEKTNRAAEVHRELANLVRPLREQVGKLDLEITAAEAELRSLRGARKEAARALGILDPDSKPAPKPRAKAKVTNRAKGLHVAPATQAAIRTWIQGHRDELNTNGGFSGTMVFERDDFTLTGRSTLDKVLTTMHEDGLLRIDRRGQGGARYFKVV